MSKANKTKDPAEAAFSAIEDVLNSKSTKRISAKVSVKTPSLPRIDEPQVENIPMSAKSTETREIEVPELTMADLGMPSAPASASPPGPAPTGLAPPNVAANDDRRSSTSLLNGLQERPSRKPFLVATLLSLGWLAILGYFVSQQYDAAISTSGGYFASGNIPMTAAMLLAALLPITFIFAVAVLLRRAQEMRIAARAMTEAALRLSQPEVIASDSVFSLGQAIRREVASMGDGIERAVARASELETLVHSEVSQLERSYAENEMKIRTLLDELAIQREAINNSASSVRMSIMGAHDNLSTDMLTVAQRISDTVDGAGQKVVSAMDERREQIAQSLRSASDDMIEQINLRSTEMSDRLLSTGETVTQRLNESVDHVNGALQATSHEFTQRFTTSAEEVNNSMRATSDAFNQQFIATADEMNNTMRLTSDEFSQRFTSTVENVNISMRTTSDAFNQRFIATADEMNNTMRLTSDEFSQRFFASADQVNQSVRATSDDFTQRFTSTVENVNSSMRATSESLIMDLGLRGAEVAQRIDESGAKIAETITNRGETLNNRLIETGNKVADTVTTRGDSLAARLVETSDRINESITIHGKGLEENLATTGQHAAQLIAEQVLHAKGAFEGAGQTIVTLFSGQTSKAESTLNAHADDIQAKLGQHSDQVRARLAETGKDIVLAIATQGNRVNEALAENARGLSSTLESHSVRVADQLHTFDDTVGQRLTNVETLMTTHGEGLMSRLVSYSDTVTLDMQKQVDAFEQAATTRTSALSGSFDELITRVDAGLERRGVQLNEQLSKQAIEIARIMSEGGRDVTTAMETKASEIDSIIVTRTSSMADSLGARAEDISKVLALKANEINQTLGGRADEIAETLDNRIGAFEERVVGRLDTVSQTIDQKGFQFAASLTQRTEAINSAFSTSGEELARTLEARGIELASRIEKSSAEYQATIVDGAERSISELSNAHKKLTGDIATVLGRLNEANTVLNTIVSSASTNLEAVETGLSERVKALESVMTQVILDTSKTSQRVEKQVALLKDVSGGVLLEAAAVSENIHARGAALAKVAEDLNLAQNRLDLALGDKHEDIRALVSTLEQRSAEIEGTMTRFNSALQEGLTNAEQKARDISSTLLESSETANASIKEQHDIIRATTAKERDRTTASLRAAYEQVMGEMGDVLSKTTDNFRATADQLRSVSGEIAQELEATRAEVSRSSLSMPRDISAQTSSIKRAVGEQLKALNELNSIVDRSGLDVAPPQAPSRRAVETPPAPRVAARPSAPLPSPAPRQIETATPPRAGGWLSDLLNKASSEPAPLAKASKAATVEQGLESLDSISTDIARLVDADAVSEVWDRYTRGERNVFSRRLYTLQGQQSFDEVRRRYRRETEFREAIDRYIEEFERLLRDVAANGKDSSVAQNYLMSDTGKVYTMLAHASGRFE